MTYNLSFMDNATLTSIFVGVSSNSDNLLMLFFLLSIWIVLILTFYDKTDSAGLFIGTGFIMVVLSGLMLAAGLITGWIVIIPVLVVIAGILFKYMN